MKWLSREQTNFFLRKKYLNETYSRHSNLNLDVFTRRKRRSRSKKKNFENLKWFNLDSLFWRFFCVKFDGLLTSVKSFGDVPLFFKAKFFCLEARLYSAMDAPGSSRLKHFIRRQVFKRISSSDIPLLRSSAFIAFITWNLKRFQWKVTSL